jgi:hypothetical protein
MWARKIFLLFSSDAFCWLSDLLTAIFMSSWVRRIAYHAVLEDYLLGEYLLSHSAVQEGNKPKSSELF